MSLWLLLFLAGDATEDDVTRAATRMYDAWSDELTRQGFESPDPDHGFDVKVLTLNEVRENVAGYLAKGRSHARRPEKGGLAGEVSDDEGRAACS